MKIFFTAIFALLFFSAKSQTVVQGLDTISFDTIDIDNSGNYILIEYKNVKGLDTLTYYRETTRCPIQKTRVAEDEMIQSPTGATYYFRKN